MLAIACATFRRIVRYWIVKAARQRIDEIGTQASLSASIPQDSHGPTKRKFNEEKFREYVERNDRRCVGREGNGEKLAAVSPLIRRCVVRLRKDVE